MPAKKKQSKLSSTKNTTTYKKGGELDKAQWGNLGRAARQLGKLSRPSKTHVSKYIKGKKYSPITGNTDKLVAKEKAMLDQAKIEAAEIMNAEKADMLNKFQSPSKSSYMQDIDRAYMEEMAAQKALDAAPQFNPPAMHRDHSRYPDFDFSGLEEPRVISSLNTRYNHQGFPEVPDPNPGASKDLPARYNRSIKDKLMDRLQQASRKMLGTPKNPEYQRGSYYDKWGIKRSTGEWERGTRGPDGQRRKHGGTHTPMGGMTSAFRHDWKINSKK